MIGLAHHEAMPIMFWAITFGGPTLLALKVWLWERRHANDHDTTDNG